MMKQYFEIKEKHRDHILFFRLGDFYEMFYDDAIEASKELELVLTSRDCGQEKRAPMCGVPYHSSDNYIARLIKKGYKIAICEQVEDPSKAKGVVRREVIRVITPGTILESDMLDEDRNNFICSIYCALDGYGVVFADVSTGEAHLTDITRDADQTLINELGRFTPSEVVFNPAFLDKIAVAEYIKTKLHSTVSLVDEAGFEIERSKQLIKEHFGADKSEGLGLYGDKMTVSAMGGLLSYLMETQRHGIYSLQTINIISGKQYMELGAVSRRNLEITETMMDKQRKGSLLWVLDKTKTSMGKRLIRSYAEMPLINPSIITKRLAAVNELFDDTMLLEEIIQKLSRISDLERIMTRVIYGSVTPRELKSLQYTFSALPQLKEHIIDAKAQYLKDIYIEIDPLDDVCSKIAESIDDDAPAILKNGGVIRRGFNAQLDELRAITSDNRGYIASIERSEREKTGIKNLKIGYNKVFGYYIEVTQSNIKMVPEYYIRKQTLSNCERYITQELKELEQKVLAANERILALENMLFNEVRLAVAEQLHRIQATAQAIARLDVFCSFAKAAREHNYCRPEINLSDRIDIKDGRHPVVELMCKDTPFVSNGAFLNSADRQVAIITGPNMAGKSTYMRQIAIIVLMAQIGSYVPASSAEIGIVDGIYTRVGASDDLSSGQSTFMVEMSEVAYILKNAGSKGLVILDEIGRGTSTFDGMSIARAVVEYIADKKKLGARTLFATHYHELTELESQLYGVKNLSVAVKKRGSDVIFLRRIVEGGADESYGIYVSKLAGIPDAVVKRAGEILEMLESGQHAYVKKGKEADDTVTNQLIITGADDSEIIKRLKEIDVNALTPIQAINLLNELKALV